jgi:hypothetical protein
LSRRNRMIVARLRKAYVAAKLCGGSRLTTRARHRVATAARYPVPGISKIDDPCRRYGVIRSVRVSSQIARAPELTLESPWFVSRIEERIILSLPPSPSWLWRTSRDGPAFAWLSQALRTWPPSLRYGAPSLLVSTHHKAWPRRRPCAVGPLSPVPTGRNSLHQQNSRFREP